MDFQPHRNNRSLGKTASSALMIINARDRRWAYDISSLGSTRQFGTPRLNLCSRASLEPVEAPEGAAARPIAPSSVTTSTSTVGFPLESRISLPITLLMLIKIYAPFLVDSSLVLSFVLYNCNDFCLITLSIERRVSSKLSIFFKGQELGPSDKACSGSG